MGSGQALSELASRMGLLSQVIPLCVFVQVIFWPLLSMLKAIQFAEEKGKGEELRATVLLLLAKKFKIDILPDEITQEIESADIGQLRKVREDIFEIESLDEVREYF